MSPLAYLLLLLSVVGGATSTSTVTTTLPPTPTAASQAPTIEGAWQGVLAAGVTGVHVVVHFHQAGAKWTATVDSPDQGGFGIPVDQVTLDGDHVTFMITRLAASFSGVRAGESISGTFKQGPASLPLELRRTDHPIEAKLRPQEPKRPYPYDEIEVAVSAEAPVGRAMIACTLTRPKGAGPFPAVVLVTGSGPQNRDEALMGHKPFLVLADALTRKGIAVLRCDDRGTGKSTGSFAIATTHDFLADALAALGTLRARRDIDPAHVGLAGHSEGGLIAAMAAAKSKDVAFIVMLAGTGLPGDQILPLQGALIGKAAGQSAGDIKLTGDLLRASLVIVKSEKDDATAAKKIRAHLAALPEAERPKLNISPAELDAQITGLLTPWFRTFLALDPRPFLRAVTVPVLAINGERDLQVPPKDNLPEITKALAGNPDATLKELPGLNHLFQRCKTGAPAEYAVIDETMSPAALELIGDWIVAQVHRR